MRYDVVHDRSQSNSAGTTGHASPQTNRGWHEGQDKVPYANQLAINLLVEVMHMPEYKGIKNNKAGQSLSSPLHACRRLRLDSGVLRCLLVLTNDVFLCLSRSCTCNFMGARRQRLASCAFCLG